MFKSVHRPFQEIQFTRDEVDTSQLNEIATWANSKAQYFPNDDREEYLLSMPHPNHPSLGGMSFDEFTEDCPPLLKEILSEIYSTKIKQMNNEKWTSDFDLENDFGFILVVIL
jgi:hypothetical protein